MKQILLPLACLMIIKAHAQDSTQAGKVSFSGYAEAYYSYDFNNPANHQKPGFMYSHNRHNELNVNLALVKANYTSDRVRGNVALMAGTYAEANLAAEPNLLQHVYEANAGVRIGRNLWVDAGIMPSHIGFESAIGKDCYTLTRSIAADNSPYYEAGAKVTWDPNDKWTLSAMYLNGWQRIRKVDGNQTPSFGTQVTFRPSGKVTLNYSTFIGNDKPDSTRQMRYFNDLYGNFTITDKFSLTAGMDYGFEQKEKSSSDMNQWYGSTVIARYAFTGKLALAGRAEYYSDRHGVIISTGTPNGFKTTGYSLNLDVTPAPNVMFRIEGRLLHSKDEIFLKDGEPKNNNASVTASLAFWF
jgi:hypothetical protein